VERTVEERHSMLRKNGSAAFSVTAGAERLVVVAEVELELVHPAFTVET
jgi:hypothetical protein